MHKLSVIIINYNSEKFFHKVKKSIESVLLIDFPEYELVIIDNGSRDNSPTMIKGIIEGERKVKFIQLSRNYGFATANNIALKYTDKSSKFIMLLNNDAYLDSENIKYFVEFLIQNKNVAAIQGVILDSNKKVDTYGNIIDELLNIYPLCHGYDPSVIPDRIIPITYADGAISIYRKDIIEKQLRGRLFVDEFFAYYEDLLTGLILWNKNYKVVTLPYVIGVHDRGSTFKEFSKLKNYLQLRNALAVNRLCNTRYSLFTYLYHIRKFLTITRDKIPSKEVAAMLISALSKARTLARNIGRIDIYRAPIIVLDKKRVLTYLLHRRGIFKIILSEINKNISKT